MFKCTSILGLSGDGLDDITPRVSWERPVTAEPFCSDSCFHGNSDSAGLWEVEFLTGKNINKGALRQDSKVSKKKTQNAAVHWQGDKRLLL